MKKSLLSFSLTLVIFSAISTTCLASTGNVAPSCGAYVATGVVRCLSESQCDLVVGEGSNFEQRWRIHIAVLEAKKRDGKTLSLPMEIHGKEPLRYTLGGLAFPREKSEQRLKLLQEAPCL